MLNPDEPRHDAPWSNGPLTEESYGHYLRHQANTSERKPRPVPHLTSTQLARLDSLSRTIVSLPTVRGVYTSGYRFVGATIANERGNSWYYYECRECRSDEARWLVWAFGRDVGPDVLLVIPIKTDDSTAIDTRAACEAIAKVGGLDGLAASIERWVMTGETAGEAHAAP
jgi:hypothetical protein